MIDRIPPWFWITLVTHVAVLGVVAYLILLERKVASWVQDRVGPNRVGFDFGILPIKFHFWGLGQPLADGLKFVLKEDYRPRGVDRILFTIAPAVMIIVVIVSIAVIPWGGVKRSSKQVVLGELVPYSELTRQQRTELAARHVPSGATVVGGQPRVDGAMVGELRDGVVYETRPGEGKEYAVGTVTYQYPFQIANLNIGVLFILAVLSLAVYGVVIGGWASNNKYSFLGGLRATANMISYEIPLGLSVLTIALMFGTLDLAEIVDKQAHYWGFQTRWGEVGIPAWNVFCQPVAFFLFLVCIHAEANRAPFDVAEAEQELVGGYHTEYSAMRFALFFLAEYAGMITTSAVCVALFFGGWHLPWLGGNVDPNSPAVTDSMWVACIRYVVFFAKTLLVIFVFMWVRWSLPRFRFDQIMQLAWRALIPISLALLMVTAVVMYVLRDVERPLARVPGRLALALLVANAGLIVLTGLASMVVPAAPDTNRKIRVANSRFNRTPLPGSGVAAAPALDRATAEQLPVGPPEVAGRVGT
jgi:NADH-quinone oxidoreductase subunit H